MFNSEKYNSLLNKLEISEISLSHAKSQNNTFRIDSEYFKKQYLKEDNIRSKYKNLTLGDVAFITDGQHGYHEVDESSNIFHLTAKNTKNWFADNKNADRLAKWVDDNNKRSSLEERDLILSTRGSVGYCAIVRDDVLPSNIDQDVARIKINGDSLLLPEYVLTYLNSKFGQDWMKRNSSGMVQQGLPLAKVRELPIPVLKNDIQEKIKVIIDLCYNLKQRSIKLIQEAETELLAALGFEKIEPITENISIKNFKDSFLTEQRIDAEYFHPKYEELINILTKSGVELQKAGDVIPGITTGQYCSEYVSEGNYYLRGVNINQGTIDEDALLFITPEHQDISKTVYEGNIVVTRVGTIGVAGRIPKSLEGATASDNLIILRTDEKRLNSRYLTLYLNSYVGSSLMIRNSRGSVQQRLNQETLKEIVIPILPMETQDSIADKVIQSEDLRNYIKMLLNSVTEGIEKALEQDETIALQWLNEKIDNKKFDNEAICQ